MVFRNTFLVIVFIFSVFEGAERVQVPIQLILPKGTRLNVEELRGLLAESHRLSAEVERTLKALPDDKRSQQLDQKSSSGFLERMVRGGRQWRSKSVDHEHSASLVEYLHNELKHVQGQLDSLLEDVDEEEEQVNDLLAEAQARDHESDQESDDDSLSAGSLTPRSLVGTSVGTPRSLADSTESGDTDQLRAQNKALSE